jgi:hypothetical protein
MLTAESKAVDTLANMVPHAKDKEIQKQLIRALDYLASKRKIVSLSKSSNLSHFILARNTAPPATSDQRHLD